MAAKAVQEAADAGCSSVGLPAIRSQPQQCAGEQHEHGEAEHGVGCCVPAGDGLRGDHDHVQKRVRRRARLPAARDALRVDLAARRVWVRVVWVTHVVAIQPPVCGVSGSAIASLMIR